MYSFSGNAYTISTRHAFKEARSAQDEDVYQKGNVYIITKEELPDFTECMWCFFFSVIVMVQSDHVLNLCFPSQACSVDKIVAESAVDTEDVRAFIDIFIGDYYTG